ncbi:MAG: MBL fold metallo-hydrolase [Thermoproteota archaeon]
MSPPSSVITKPGKSEVAVMLLNKYSCIHLATETYRLLLNPSEIDVRNIDTLDYVLVTDEQPEHFDENLIIELYRLKRTGKIIADETSYRILRSQMPKEVLIAATPNKVLVSDGLIIKSYPSENPEASTPVTYLISFENGCKILQTGASPILKALKKVAMEEKPDIVFIPVGFGPRLSMDTWMESAKNANSKIIIPYYGEVPNDFQKLVKKKGLKATVTVLKIGEPFVYRIG